MPQARIIRIQTLYSQLLAVYRPQGWWPLLSRAGRGGFDEGGYHPGRFDVPRASSERFEVVLGAVLTQNTAWTNAEKALRRLREAGITVPADITGSGDRRIAALVRASGYFNQKARKIESLAALFAPSGRLTPRGRPDRDTLLGEWGIGPETADSILLYAFQAPVFVVDAYTRRLLERMGILEGGESYAKIQVLIEAALRAGHAVYNEFHALIVAHAKRHCRKRPVCRGCPVKPCRLGDSPRA